VIPQLGAIGRLLGTSVLGLRTSLDERDALPLGLEGVAVGAPAAVLALLLRCRPRLGVDNLQIALLIIKAGWSVWECGAVRRLNGRGVFVKTERVQSGVNAAPIYYANQRAEL
jgi:hypothetical protein